MGYAFSFGISTVYVSPLGEEADFQHCRRGGLIQGRMFVNQLIRHYTKPLLGAGVFPVFIFGIFKFFGLNIT
jgi:hypothetical protein